MLLTPSLRLMYHCCAIDSRLFVSQYSTRPAGKKKNMTLNASGMIHISLACTGSGGVGLSQVWNIVDKVINTGSGPTGIWIHGMVKNSASALARSLTYSQLALCISTDDSST